MQGLRGIRMAVCTESEETDEFAEGNVKRVIGEATLTSKALYSDYVTFATTQLVRSYILTLSPLKLKESLGLEVEIKQSDLCFSLGREFPKRSIMSSILAIVLPTKEHLQTYGRFHARHRR
jgi:hypothetical protein